MKSSLLLISFLFIGLTAQATVYRINNAAGTDPDFADIQTAISSALVSPGDTLHVEPSATDYAGFSLTKRLVILGNGYFLIENPGLKANTSPSRIGGSITINNTAASNSVISGLTIAGLLTLTNASNILFVNCLITSTVNISSYTTLCTGIQFRKCFISGFFGIGFSGAGNLTMTVENCIISPITGLTATSTTLPTAVQGLFRNNILAGSLSNLSIHNFYFTNNIIIGNSGSPLGGSGNTARNNLNRGTGLLAGEGQNSVILSSIFVDPLMTGTGDARFQLAVGSTAIGAGESIPPVMTPTCGAFGGPDPYRLSGIPAIPSVYFLSVPTNASPVDATMNVTISTRSNN